MNVNLNVTGMSCSHCQAAVKKALEKVSGVNEAHVDLQAGQAEVRGEGLDPQALVKAVEGAGYGASAR
ncbi:MAG TPA: heavy metal-associated domain-containing protein [Deinococcales bacterium]|nr:heavy metal-associated domain-containing protein [Deinococcales bacterium]